MAEDTYDPAEDRIARDAELWRGEQPTFVRWLAAMSSRSIKIATTLILFVVLLSVLVYYLLLRTERTPIIAIRTATYAWPFPPQAWVAEDLATIADLDNDEEEHFVTVNFNDVNLVSTEKGPIIVGLDTLSTKSRIGEAIIFYVSMHGVAQGGEPYLVPPGASPHDKKTWWHVRDLLINIDEQLKLKNADDKLKLIVLDCSRVSVNWYLGWSQNDFAAALESWWNDHNGRQQFPRFALLSAASSGEQSWTSRKLENSVLAHYFHRGMAGEADVSNGWFTKSVTLGELETYLRNSVSRWVRKYRADQQTPLLLLSSDDQRAIALTTSNYELGEASATNYASVIEGNRLDLWKSLGELRSRELYRFDPLGWRHLEHQLLWLDQLADSGLAYQQKAQSTYSSLKIQLDAIHDRLTTAKRNRSLTGYANLISGDRAPFASPLKLRSLPLARYMGSLPTPTIEVACSALANLQSTPGPQQLARSRRTLERFSLNDFAEAHFLQMLDRYQYVGLWRNSQGLQQLLALRSPSQDYGVPVGAEGFLGDERVHGWVRVLANSADHARREVEDRLFVDGQPEFADKLATAKGSTESALKAMEVLQNAMRVRDRVWAELPYLMEWHANPLRSVDDVENFEELSTNLAQIVTTTRQLEVLLSPPDPSAPHSDVDGALVAIEKLSKQTGGQWSALKNVHFNAECVQLKSSGSTAANFRNIAAVLANPWLPTDMRVQFDRRYHAFDRSEEDSNLATADQWPANAAGSENSPDHPKRSAPSLQMSLLVEGEVSNPLDFDVRWQREIKSLQDTVAAAVEAGRESRHDWNRLDQRLRPVAALVYKDANGVPDRLLGQPTRVLRAIDSQDLVHWHADRVLRDFWGPAGDKAPFFYVAANDYLDSAPVLINGPRPNSVKGTEPDKFADFRAEIERQMLAATKWLQTGARNALLLDSGGDATTQIEVTNPHSSEPSVAGTAAVFVGINGSRIDGVTFSPSASVALPLRSHMVEASISGSTVASLPADQISGLDAMTVFRGHEFGGRFRIDQLGGVVVEESPYAYGPGKVTLRSPWRSLSVVIILDCSQSMDEPLASGESRLTVAKAAVVELLSALSSKQDVRVGIRMFGHRMGWSTDRPVRILKSPTYTGLIPPDLTPDRDVERVLPLSEFDFNSAQAVFAALQEVVHGWGQSPLYLSLEQTLEEDFADTEPDSDRHVIVITDGRDYQARPTPADRTSASEVVSAARSKGIPIHVLSFGDNAANELPATARSNDLAAGTNGIQKNVPGSIELRSTLRAIVRPDLYQLAEADGQIVDRAELGVTLYDGSQRSPAWYSVQYEDAFEKVFLEGGEAIDFYTELGDQRLYAYPYNHDVAAETWFRGSGHDSDLLLARVHRPLRAGRNVEFRVSLQRAAASASESNPVAWFWTPRPKEAWIEIAPLLKSGQPAGPKYLFYDANFVSDQPVPLLDLVARDWPSEATRAQVSAWYGTELTKPSLRLEIDDKEVPLPNGSTLRVDADWADESTKSYCMRIVERHPAPTRTDHWLKVVAPAAPSLRPSRVIRQFDERHGVAIHTFIYSNLEQADIDQLHSAGIGVLPRQAALAASVAVEPVMVSISSSGELLPLAGSSGSTAPAVAASISHSAH